ncbi:MAG: OmpA family protein [Gammaproteobacteria bacterium]|nr:OmpA family protein [Gammaproteobacteria bacterium]
MRNHSHHQRGAGTISRFILTLICAVMMITGCYHKFVEEHVTAKCPEVISDNIILCPSPKVCTPAANRQIMCVLRHQAVQVNRVGEDMQIIIPSDHLFRPVSASFNEEYLHVLKAVGLLLQCYNKVDVKIEGYTDCCGNENRNVALSTTQAKKVAKYLWEHGADSRLLYTKGYGSLNPIANSDTYYGRARNRRIEIIFRDHPHWD